jgi:histidinol phosphatase-like enzyme
MILQAKKEYKLDLSNSILIGDRNTDLEAGKNAGIKNLVKIRTNDVEDYIENNLNV